MNLVPFLLFLCLKTAYSAPECTDMVSMAFNNNIDHGPARTIDENVTTAIVMEDTVFGSNIYYGYIRPVCKQDCKIKYNCLSIKTLTSYKDFKPMSKSYCWDKEVSIYANCKLPTIRIVKGYVICQLEYEPLTNKNKVPTIAKISLRSGKIVVARRFSDGEESTSCLKTRVKPTSCFKTIEQYESPSCLKTRAKTTTCFKTIEQFNIEIMMSESGLWISYPKASHKGTYYVHHLSIKTLRDISMKKEFPLAIKQNERAVVVCNKLYVMSVKGSITLTRAFDLKDSRNKFFSEVKFALGTVINHQSWIHYNPKLQKFYLGAPNDVQTKVFKLNRCTAAFPENVVPEIHSTFLWALEPSNHDNLGTMVESIMKYFSISDKNKLSQISSALISCPAFVCNKVNRNEFTRLYCIVKSQTTSLKIYSNYKNEKNKQKLLQVKFSIYKILEQESFRSISTQIHGLKTFTSLQFDELKSQINTFRSSIGKYFLQLATFDSKKSKADIDFIYTNLDKYNNEFKRKSGVLTNNLQIILKKALAVVIIDTADKVQTLALRVATLFNPVSAIVEGAGPIVDAKEAANDLANHLTKYKNLAKLNSLLSKLATKLNKNLGKVSAVFKTQTSIRKFIFSAMNKDLDNKELTKYADGFIKQYNDFDPGYDAVTITEIGSILELILEEGCRLITEGESVGAAVVKGLSVDNCYDSTLDVQILITLFEEMASFRDSLMEAMASFVRALVATNNVDAILNIEKGLTKVERERNLLALRVYTTQIFIASEVHTIMLVREACNLIEYLNGGIMPVFCEKAISNPHGLYYGRVKAFPFDREMCFDQINSFVNIPAKYVTNPTKLPVGTLDIKSLFNGNEVNFQVPDRNWLIKNGWVEKEDATEMLVLKRFQVYVPISDTFKQRINVHVSTAMVGSNDIVPLGIIYPFNMAVKYNFRYSENEYPCENEAKNPYRKPKNICLKSEGTDNLLVHPSIYALWKMKMSIANLNNPQFNVSDKYLKGAVSICVVPRGGRYRRSRP